MGKYIVTEIRIKKLTYSGQFQYELWGQAPGISGCVFLGSNDFHYDSEPLARKAGIDHAKEYPYTYILNCV